MISTFIALTPLLVAAAENPADPPVILPPSFDYVHQVVEWPKDISDATLWADADTFSESAVGKLLPYWTTGVFLRGTQVFLMDGIQGAGGLTRFNARTSLNMNKVQALTIARGVGTDGGDRLLTAGTRYGLVDHLCQSDGSFVSTNFDSTTPAKRISLMRAVDLYESGQDRDVICIEGENVQVLTWTAGSWVHGTTITATDTVLDAVVCNQDGYPNNELVCLLEDKVEVYGLGGTLINTITPPTGSTFEAITSVPPMPYDPPGIPWQIGDRLVLVCHDQVLDHDSIQIRTAQGVSQTLDLHIPYDEYGLAPVDPYDATWIQPGDVDSDGRTDLIVSGQTWPLTLVFLRNESGAYSWENEELIMRVPFARDQEMGDVGGNLAQPVFWSTGPYARTTLVRPVEKMGWNVPPANEPPSISIAMTPSPIGVDANVLGVGAVGSSGSPTVHAIKYAEGTNLTLRITPPVGTVVDTDIWAQVTFWEYNETTGYLNSVGGHGWFPLDGNSVGSGKYKVVVPLDVLDNQTNAPAAPLPPAGPTPSSNPIYWVYLRIIQADVDGNGDPVSFVPLDESDWAYVAFRMQPDPPETQSPFYDAEIQSLPYIIELKRLIEDIIGGGGGGAEYGAVALTDIGGSWSPSELPAVAQTPYVGQ